MKKVRAGPRADLFDSCGELGDVRREDDLRAVTARRVDLRLWRDVDWRRRRMRAMNAGKRTPVATHALTKDYGAHRGIFDLDLAVNEGEVFGFLGPNGAGKTTTIKLLMGMIHPTRGGATVFGLDSDRDAVAVKRQVGYVPGETPQFGGWR